MQHTTVRKRCALKTIVFFNNKGGVGKTTLCGNIAAHFAQSGYRVVLIDCDPQCNSTLLVLGETVFANALAHEAAVAERFQNILDVVQPINDGDPEPNVQVLPEEPDTNRFGISLLAGHPRLSLIEDKLSSAWAALNSGDVGGFRISNWFYKLVQNLGGHFDVALVDVGPSLGSLNRSVLIGADYFVTPMGCDIFSLIGIRNISEWLRDWLRLYKNGYALCHDRQQNRLEQFNIVEKLAIAKGFAGYTVQQYITKSKQGVRRPTEAYERILDNIEPEIRKYLKRYYASSKRHFVSKLGDVPSMYSLVPLAQSANAPINSLGSSDGLVGSQFKQAERYGEILDQVAETLSRNIELTKCP